MPNYDKCITSNDFNKFSGRIFDVRLKQTKSATITDVANLISKIYFDE